ncbi:M67 family metallopeptidase [Thermococcus sp.]|uniref:M67 family metallopeptidase n=1 Tax=Thermococcus sp. TaxID=35749 RepID=UPI00260E72E6|nr:M67 family metallopeptidase [Thermococcus sp.]
MVIERARKSKIEICGLLFGRKSQGEPLVEEVVGVPNSLGSEMGFRMEPTEAIRAIENAERKGLELVGIYHSHLRCPPLPSEKDAEGRVLRNDKVEEVRIKTT